MSVHNAANDVFATPHDILAKLTVLVVDPDRPSRQFLADMVSDIGVDRVLTAASAEEAMQRVAGGIDIVLIDGARGEIDGVAFAREVRRGFTDRRRDTMIAACLSTPTIGRIGEARDAGVNAVILKPMSIRGLTAKLIQMATHPRPFIETAGYAGPDRRVGQTAHHRGPWRRHGDKPRPLPVP